MKMVTTEMKILFENNKIGVSKKFQMQTVSQVWYQAIMLCMIREDLPTELFIGLKDVSVLFCGRKTMKKIE